MERGGNEFDVCPETAAVFGTVSDPSLLPIGESKVTLTSIDTGSPTVAGHMVAASAVTNSAGKIGKAPLPRRYTTRTHHLIANLVEADQERARENSQHWNRPPHAAIADLPVTC